jgi:hypothetical protein
VGTCGLAATAGGTLSLRRSDQVRSTARFGLGVVDGEGAEQVFVAPASGPRLTISPGERPGAEQPFGYMFLPDKRPNSKGTS